MLTNEQHIEAMQHDPVYRAAVNGIYGRPPETAIEILLETLYHSGKTNEVLTKKSCSLSGKP